MEFKDIIDAAISSDSGINLEYPIGYRAKEMLNHVIIGRQRDLFIQKKYHVSNFAIVSLNSIIASHNEQNFSSSENYPQLNGMNVNDRNYEKDKNAQATVVSISQNIIPSILISTGATSSGTPIITIDGIVVSGNNRVMSLKLAKQNSPIQYQKYLDELKEELSFGGYGEDLKRFASSMTMNEYKIATSNSSFHSPEFIEIKDPVLVRIDQSFEGYAKPNLNQFNVQRGKAERPIDMAARLSDMLSQSNECQKRIIDILNQIDIPSEIYTNKNLLKSFQNALLFCNIITEKQLPKYFTSENNITDEGKTLYSRLLLSMIFDPKTVEIVETPGVKSFSNKIMSAVLDLTSIKDKYPVFISWLNEAIQIYYSSVMQNIEPIDYLRNQKLFTENINYESIILLSSVLEGQKSFKEKTKKFKQSLDSNLSESESMFDDLVLTPEQIFTKIFESNISKEYTSLVDFYKNKLNLQEASLDNTANNEIDEVITLLIDGLEFLNESETNEIMETIEGLKLLM